MFADEGMTAADAENNLLKENESLHPNVPTSASYIADQLERGGARVEETLNRLSLRYQTFFFIAGLGIVAAGVVGTITFLISLTISHLITSLFLSIFGVTMVLLDVPGCPRWAFPYRVRIRKHIRCLTRITGKSIWFIFLGCLTACNLWPYDNDSRAKIILTGFVTMLSITVGLVGLLIALRKTLRLEKIRKIVQASSHGMYADVYRKYAVTDPQHGLQFEEFNRMAADHTAGKCTFDVVDLGIIYNAIDETHKSSVNEREFVEFLSGPMTFL